jgi:hypothetical protein
MSWKVMESVKLTWIVTGCMVFVSAIAHAGPHPVGAIVFQITFISSNFIPENRSVND